MDKQIRIHRNRTKEELLNKFPAAYSDEAKAAMDEYAEQTAIEYAHWVLKRMKVVESAIPVESAEALYKIFREETGIELKPLIS